MLFLTSAALACLAGATTAQGAYLGSAASLHLGRLGNEPVDPARRVRRPVLYSWTELSSANRPDRR